MTRKIFTSLLMFSLFLLFCTNTAVNAHIKVNSTQKIEISLMTENKDLGEYFDGFNGCAVFFTPADNRYTVYNPALCELRSSPCSTFKIVSGLMGLEEGVIDPANSTYKWNKTTYWNDVWNRDIGFEDAFKTSCVWYFREVIDRVGKENTQNFLSQLDYGNNDISDWQGFLNKNNNSTDLRGFWIESSLKISPPEQVNVLQRIFASNRYNQRNINLLKQVMLVENTNGKVNIYGKTGMGVANGKCIDAWFVGMFEVQDKTTYFAVRLDDPDNAQTSSKKAREIAINIINSMNQ